MRPVFVSFMALFIWTCKVVQPRSNLVQPRSNLLQPRFVRILIKSMDLQDEDVTFFTLDALVGSLGIDFLRRMLFYNMTEIPVSSFGVIKPWQFLTSRWGFMFSHTKNTFVVIQRRYLQEFLP